MNTTHRYFKLLILALALVGLSAIKLAVAEEQKVDPEAKQAADEDAAEKNLPEDAQMGKQYNGLFSTVLPDSTTPNPQVVGTFLADNGQTFLIKLVDPAIMKRLSLYDNKKVVLSGKVRNQGKYLVVIGVIETPPGPVMRRKRGGM